MPPWKAVRGDFAFKGDRRLTDAQIETCSAGSRPACPRAIRRSCRRCRCSPHGWELGPPDLVVTMPEAFDVPADGPDVYRNFVMPLNLTEDRWVRAVDFRPSARTRRASQPVLSRRHRAPRARRTRAIRARAFPARWAGSRARAATLMRMLSGGKSRRARVGGQRDMAASTSRAGRHAWRLGARRARARRCPRASRSSCRRARTSFCRRTFIRRAKSSTKRRSSGCISPTSRRRRRLPASRCRRCSGCSKAIDIPRGREGIHDSRIRGCCRST